MYNTLILPYLSYCITIWGNTYNCYTNRIVILQKKVLRIITFSHRLAHTTPLFSRLNILKFEHLYKYHVNIFMFNYLHNKLPICYENFFTNNTDLYEYNTRRRNDVSLVFRKLVVCRMGLKYNGPRLYNSLDKDIRNIPSIYSFKKAIRRLYTLWTNERSCSSFWYCIVMIVVVFHKMIYIIFMLLLSTLHKREI